MDESRFKYQFVTEDGVEDLTYSEYLGSAYLRGCINDVDRKRLVMGRRIFSYSEAYLRAHPDKHKLLQALEEEKRRNPLAYFCPSGDKARAFLNDTASKIKLLTAPNRAGKTVTAIIHWLLRTLPCDPQWPIFTECGVKWTPYKPPEDGFHVGFATYKWANQRRVIWPEFRKWIPHDMLGPYGPDWGGRKKVISWDRNPHLPLTCPTTYYFYVYEMEQDQFEGQAHDGWQWDEQGEEAKWVGANERTRTRKGQHVFALTPHHVKGRPDTGGGSWIHKIVKAEDLKGYTPDQINTYHMMLDDVPDWIFPEEEKAASYRQHIEEPLKRNDMRAYREGRSRHYGEWEFSEGLVYRDWNREYHVIDPFIIPDTFCLWRSVDHGRRNPTACLWGAVSPPGWKDIPFPVLILYREYYVPNRLISEHAKAIIEASKNTRTRDGKHKDERAGVVYERYREEQTVERYPATLFDPRSYKFPDPSTGMTLSQLYNINGLKMVAGKGSDYQTFVEVVEEWLRVDHNVKHPFYDKMGCPRVMVFSGMKNFIYEMEHYVNEEYMSKRGNDHNLKEKPRAKDDHLMDAFKWMCQHPVKWLRHYTKVVAVVDNPPKRDSMPKRRNDMYTGY